jgi:hypothetical protein
MAGADSSDNILGIISFNALVSGSKDNPPKHGLLLKEEVEVLNSEGTPKPGTHYKVVPTKKFLSYLDGDNFLLIIDEADSTKEDTVNFQAISTLAYEILKTPSNRIICLSMTPRSFASPKDLDKRIKMYETGMQSGHVTCGRYLCMTAKKPRTYGNIFSSPWEVPIAKLNKVQRRLVGYDD